MKTMCFNMEVCAHCRIDDTLFSQQVVPHGVKNDILLFPPRYDPILSFEMT